ncbi:MAG TPA: hypothetical protein VL240_06700 [Candidatus Binatia bacterium]|nr:hypothetical protein [Candidatus Binatia bacterium]
MPRLYFCLRLIAVAVAVPAILVYIAMATVAHAIIRTSTPVRASRSSRRVPLRIWMSVLDWAKGIPVGYSYWEQYEAPIMLDEIAVHHDD